MSETKKAKATENKEAENALEKLKEIAKERQERSREAQEAMAEGKGILALEKPIMAGGQEITELVYDFTSLTGTEYADAMDSDPNANQIFKITYRQGLALFAKAAAKHTEYVDVRDIVERLGNTDATVGVQLAILFFNASTRAGRMRISKKL